MVPSQRSKHLCSLHVGSYHVPFYWLPCSGIGDPITIKLGTIDRRCGMSLQVVEIDRLACIRTGSFCKWLDVSRGRSTGEPKV